MELYFGSLKGINSAAQPYNLLTFAIPDLGVKFKAPFQAENLALEYASLLALLEFIEINPQLFTDRALELYSHSSELVQQVNNKQVNQLALVPYLKRALHYRAKLNYTINWIPRPENQAANPSC
jgi:hypothetical protein